MLDGDGEKKKSRNETELWIHLLPHLLLLLVVLLVLAFVLFLVLPLVLVLVLVLLLVLHPSAPPSFLFSFGCTIRVLFPRVLARSISALIKDELELA